MLSFLEIWLLIIDQTHHFLRIIKYLRQIVLRFLLNYYLPSSQQFSKLCINRRNIWRFLYLLVHSCMCLTSKEDCCSLRLFPDLIKSWKSWPRKKYFAVVKTKKGLSHLVVGGPRVLHSVSCAPHLLMWSPPSLHSGEEMRYRPEHRTLPDGRIPQSSLYTPHCTLHCTQSTCIVHTISVSQVKYIVQ